MFLPGKYIYFLKLFFGQEFDESNETGLENCILKVKSSDLNINNEVLKLLSKQSPVDISGNYYLTTSNNYY